MSEKKPIAGQKIARKWMAHYANAKLPGETTDKYVLLGDDLEEFSAELAAEVEKTKNILGSTKVTLSGYEKTSTVEPYYAVKGDALFDRLQDIIDNASTLDEVATDVVEVRLWEDETDGSFPAVREKAVFEVTSYGGDTTGYQIPFTLHYTGEKEKGTFDVATKKFTPVAAG